MAWRTTGWRVDGAARSLSELVLLGGAYGVRATHLETAPFRPLLFPQLAIDLAAVFRKPAR